MARIVINPTTFKNGKDALCVAFDEAFRIVMEQTAFEPQSEPTEAQRKFFSDTAYADDELQLRRTIIARICTFDTSVKDPTDAQLQESIEFLNTVLEIGAPQNEFEQRSVQRIIGLLEKAVGSSEGTKSNVTEGQGNGEAVGAEGGGSADVEVYIPGDDDEEEKRRKAEQEKAQQGQTDPTVDQNPAEPQQPKSESDVAAADFQKGMEALGMKTLGDKDPLAAAGIKVKTKEELDATGNTEPKKDAGDAQGQQAPEAGAGAGPVDQQQAQAAPVGVEITKGFVKIGDKKMTRGEYEWLKRRQASGASISKQQAALLDQAENGVEPQQKANGGFIEVNGKKMTSTEFEWLKRRQASGATLSRQQRALLGEDVSNDFTERVDNRGYRMYDDNGKKIKTRYRQLFAITGFSSPEEAGMKKRDLKNLTRLRYLGLI